MSEELTTTALKEEEFNKKVDMKVWKRLLAYGLRQKKLLIPLIVFMFIVTAAVHWGFGSMLRLR